MEEYLQVSREMIEDYMAVAFFAGAILGAGAVIARGAYSSYKQRKMARRLEEQRRKESPLES